MQCTRVLVLVPKILRRTQKLLHTTPFPTHLPHRQLQMGGGVCWSCPGGDILVFSCHLRASLYPHRGLRVGLYPQRFAGGGLHAAQQACSRAELRRRQPRCQEKRAARCTARATATRVSTALACFSRLLFPAFLSFSPLPPLSPTDGKNREMFRKSATISGN